MLNKKFKNSNKPNESKNNKGSSSQRDNQAFKQQFGNNGARNDECFECHEKGREAWECATKFNKLKKANQNNHCMHATLSDDDDDLQSHEMACLGLVTSYM